MFILRASQTSSFNSYVSQTQFKSDDYEGWLKLLHVKKIIIAAGNLMQNCGSKCGFNWVT